MSVSKKAVDGGDEAYIHIVTNAVFATKTLVPTTVNACERIADVYEGKDY